MKTQKPPKKPPQNGLKAHNNDGLKMSNEIPQSIKTDITKATYIADKIEQMSRVPKLARPFIRQYFDFLKTLTAEQVMDWMEGGERLKDLYQRSTFPERIAFAGARGLIKASKRIRDGANKIICYEAAALTIRFENPEAWEVIEVFGEEGIKKLKQGIEDIKEILKLKEETI
jgi:hypothetical protein